MPIGTGRNLAILLFEAFSALAPLGCDHGFNAPAARLVSRAIALSDYVKSFDGSSLPSDGQNGNYQYF
jgi:hypothetical protein